MGCYVGSSWQVLRLCWRTGIPGTEGLLVDLVGVDIKPSRKHFWVGCRCSFFLWLLWPEGQSRLDTRGISAPVCLKRRVHRFHRIFCSKNIEALAGWHFSCEMRRRPSTDSCAHGLPSRRCSTYEEYMCIKH